MKIRFPKEHIVIENLEQIHKYQDPTVMAGIAILKEILAEIDDDGRLPVRSMGYLQEKMEAVLMVVKKG